MDIADTMKICTTCRRELSLDNFTKQKGCRHGRKPTCRECNSRIKREIYQDGGAERCRESNFNNHLKQKYKLTREQYDAMVASANGRCSICGEKPNEKLHVDHCHSTGKVRGMLCRRCNTAMGFMKDDPWRFMSAISYIFIHHGKGSIPVPKHILEAQMAPPPAPVAPAPMAMAPMA